MKTGNWFFNMELPVLLSLVGSLSVLLVGAVIFAILLKRDMNSKMKMQGLASAAEIDAEATRDYQVDSFINKYILLYTNICSYTCV